MSTRYNSQTISFIQVTLITASGEILIANTTTNEDLFWGVRGGGGNFGVVTNFVLKLHPQPRKVFAGPVVFPPSMIGLVVSTLEEWLSTATPLANAVMALGHGPDGNPAIIVALVYHGAEEEGKKAFKPIFDLGKDNSGLRHIYFESPTHTYRSSRQYDQHDSLRGCQRYDESCGSPRKKLVRQRTHPDAPHCGHRDRNLRSPGEDAGFSPTLRRIFHGMGLLPDDEQDHERQVGRHGV